MQFLLVALLPALVNAFTFKLPPSTKECFYDDLKVGDQLLVGFHVLDGPDYQVDFWVRHLSFISLSSSYTFML